MLHKLQTSFYPTSAPDLSDALLAEWAQIRSAKLHKGEQLHLNRDGMLIKHIRM